MEYKLKVGEDTYPVEVDIKDENNILLTVGEDRLEVGYDRISEHQIHIEINGKRANAYVLDEGDGKTVILNGAPYSVVDVDLLEQRSAAGGDTDNLPDEITPAMPSVVVSVLVEEGDSVEKGKGLVVLSAMKMETTLFAPYDGKVTKVNVAQGEKVMPGDILIEIEGDE